MKVIKIKSCTQPKSWYADKIGQSFEVLKETKDHKGNKIFITHKGKIVDNYVNECDCDVVSENSTKK